MNKSGRIQTIEQHEARVETLKQQGSKGQKKKKSHRIQSAIGHDFSNFNHILEISPEEQTALVEPGVTFAQLLKTTLKYHLMPCVVPEFKTITIGGAVMGGALESSSFHFGQVSDSMLAYECLLGDGSRLWATPTEYSDLFYGISGSYGTLATVTALRMKLIPSKPFVTIRCHKSPHVNFSFKGHFSEALYLPDCSYLHLEGSLESEKTGALLSFSRPWSPSFYQCLIDQEPKELTLSLVDYLFRYDRGAFWMGHYALNRPLLRSLLLKKRERAAQQPMRGWRRLCLLPSRTLYRLLHAMSPDRYQDLFFIHDYYIPSEHVEKMVALLTRITGIFPLWLCPIKGTTTPQILSPHFGRADWVNIGCYGIATRSAKECSIEIENQILSFGGRKMLYSLTYYNKEKFEQIYGGESYHLLRQRYKASGAMPTLYEKLTKNLLV